MNKPISRSMFRGICVGAIAAGVVIFFDYAHPESIIGIITIGVCVFNIIMAVD